MKKRGYSYILDAIIATSIITLGIILFLSYQDEQSRKIRNDDLIQDFINILAVTKVEESRNEYLLELIERNYDINTKSTLLQVIGDLYSKGDRETANNLLESLSHNLINEPFELQFTLDGNVLYSTTSDRINQKLVLSTKQIILGVGSENGEE